MGLREPCPLKTNLFEFRFYTHLFMFFYMYYSPGAGETTLYVQNSDARKALSLCPFVASFTNISFKSDFITIFSYMYIAPV